MNIIKNLNIVKFFMNKYIYLILISLYFYNKFNILLNTLIILLIIIINVLMIIKIINKKKINVIINELLLEINKIFWPTHLETLRNSFIITILIILSSLILYFLDNIVFYFINSIINF
ncbi:MAG: preprotein translocase subunit SecE [Enterobacteriaceae bacterium]